MKTYIKKFVIGITVCISLLDCSGFSEVDLPQTQLTREAVFEDEMTATAALMDIYAHIREEGMLSGNIDGLSHLMGEYTDELDFYGSAASDAESFYSHSIVPSNGFVTSLWSKTYYQIYALNAFLEGLDNTNTIEEQTLNRLRGEALFLRGLFHFYLVELYGDIPYLNTTNYHENSTASRVPIQEVFDMIIGDLKQAKILLPETYPGLERVRPNKYAVSGLLARVHLYLKQWELAVQEADIVLNSDLYTLESDLNAVFLKSSRETLWQLHPGVAGANTIEARFFVFDIGPPPVTALSDHLVSVFEVNDTRKDFWTKAIFDGTTTWSQPYKYKQNSNTGVSQEYSIILRLAELFLIRSEARVHLGKIADGLEDLNTIRNRSGLADIAAQSKNRILTAILQERRVELFTELGHRFFDLKRNDLLDEVLAPLKPGWKSTNILLPIPENELILNNHLAPQNSGY